MGIFLSEQQLWIVAHTAIGIATEIPQARPGGRAEELQWRARPHKFSAQGRLWENLVQDCPKNLIFQ
ncbi:MAG: hypothetical protein ACOH1X_08025 [Kaistella sp.]